MLSRMWRSQLGAHFWQKMFGQALGGTAPRGALTELFLLAENAKSTLWEVSESFVWLLAALLALLGGGEREGGGCGPPRTAQARRNKKPKSCLWGTLYRPSRGDLDLALYRPRP